MKNEKITLDVIERQIKDAITLWHVPQDRRQNAFNEAIRMLMVNEYKMAISGGYIQSLLNDCNHEKALRISAMLRNSLLLNQEVTGFNLVLNPENPELNLLHNGCFRF